MIGSNDPATVWAAECVAPAIVTSPRRARAPHAQRETR